MSEEMTRKEAIEYLINWDKALESQGDSPFSDARRALSYGIHSLETDEAYQLEYERTTKNDLGVDCISRQAVLDLINADWKYENLEIEINNLPSVTLIRPKGHWIPVYQGDEIIDYRCSECEFGNTFGKGTIGMNYCPHCGADMREVEE